MSPVKEKRVKTQLKQVLRLMDLVLADPRLDESGQRHRYLRARREFETMCRSGKADHHRLRRMTEDMTMTLMVVMRGGTRRPK
jgi:hypothetical protein